MPKTQSQPVKKMSDDELRDELKGLDEGLREIEADFKNLTAEIEAESDKHLERMEGADLDAELKPIEEEAIRESDNQLAEELLDADDETQRIDDEEKATQGASGEEK